ncbi:hypothetical protein QMZ05_24570 [Bradyrhizobium sp. INPA03-11B]|uniref:hypothetical protein n=1 Tax=Bradyrhizobium sp. INPA03-11B TaxID=418598 RepID=UPI00338E0D0E
MTDAAELEARVLRLESLLSAVHGTAVSILSIMAQALETRQVVERAELADALERATAKEAPQTLSQRHGHDLLAQFVAELRGKADPPRWPGPRLAVDNDPS